MTEEEYKKLKIGDIVYKINIAFSCSADSVQKGEATAKHSNVVEILLPSGVQVYKYSRAFTSEEKAKAEIIRRYKDKIASSIHDIKVVMTALSSFDSEAIDDNYIIHIENAIRTQFNKLKEK